MKTKITLFSAFIILSTGSLFSADSNVSKEDREKMAETHVKMAGCLKSDRPISECHDEMSKSCSEMMGKSGCPMMDMGKMKGHDMKSKAKK